MKIAFHPFHRRKRELSKDIKPVGSGGELADRLAGREVIPVSAKADSGSVDLAGPAHPHRLLRWGAVSLLAATTVAFAARYYIHALHYETTDDAFIEGHIVQVSPRIAGHVANVFVDDNQLVKAGELLVQIDPSDYQAKLDQAKAALGAAKAREAAAQANLSIISTTSSADMNQAKAGVDQAVSAVETAKAQVNAAKGALAMAEAHILSMDAAIDQASAELVATNAEKRRAGEQLPRIEAMHEVAVASDQELTNARAASHAADARSDAAAKKVTAARAALEEARAAKVSAAAALEQATAQVVQAQAKVAESQAKLEQAGAAPQRVATVRADLDTASAEVQRLASAARQAELDLSYTRIMASEDGRVTRKGVEAGNYLQPGQAMFALVPSRLWVVANFKETQLNHIRPGQKVDVSVDAYPGLKLQGHVDSIQRGSGSRFSLLPAENATGNYVKVVQRVPVKITLDEAPDPAHALGPGMSVEPSVRIKE